MNRPTLLLALAAPWLAAFTGVAGQTPPPTADPADVSSVDGIIAAVYDVISGPAAEVRDWERFRSLFVPDAHLMPTGRSRTGSGFGYRRMTVEEYANQTGPALESTGFFEREIHRVEEAFGAIVHAFSTYESRRNSDDAVPFARGINSFQLFWDGSRWWVTTIYWFAETPELPIPSKYLPGGG